MALPFLEAMGPIARAAVGEAARSSGVGSPIRMVCGGKPLGLMPDTFFPKGEGSGYRMPEVLEPLTRHRDNFSIFSNLDHDVGGGHSAVHSFLSGIKDQDASDWPEGNISVDQRAPGVCLSDRRKRSVSN